MVISIVRVLFNVTYISIAIVMIVVTAIVILIDIAKISFNWHPGEVIKIVVEFSKAIYG